MLLTLVLIACGASEPTAEAPAAPEAVVAPEATASRQRHQDDKSGSNPCAAFHAKSDLIEVRCLLALSERRVGSRAAQTCSEAVAQCCR